LPDDVRIYCGHEYTLANACFAAHVDPGNADVARRLDRVSAQRDSGEITLPTTVADERATNPFVRARNAPEFAELRTAKDSFR
jgi:hydroxyacylglutathione hydrolase